MKVLVTGANGMLGQDLCPYLENLGMYVIKTDYDTLDITDFNQVKAQITQIHPDLIIHCAAYTNVEKAQDEIDLAKKLNVEGTKNVAIMAGQIDSTMIYISTDYVFDGTSSVPYLPSAKPNPINNYGLTKYLGELEVQKYCKKFYIARTAWLYGIHGKNFVETMIKLANDNKPIKVVDDQIGCPTSTMELIQAITKLLTKPHGIYHTCCDGQTSWYEFAKEIFAQENIKADLTPVKSAEYKTKAKRPAYSVMINENNEKLTKDWKSALSDYLASRKIQNEPVGV